MELRVLEYFLAVTREQSIMAAADYLNITQPTLSRQLKDLEEELGKQLFTRGKRNTKITLTEEGRLFRKRAQEIIDLTEKTKNEISNSEQNIAGDIYIGAGETDTMCYLVETAQEIRRDYPNFHLHVVSGDSIDLESRLDAGLFDFCLLLGNINHAKYDYLNLPWTDSWGVLMHKDSPLAKKESIAPEDLWDKPLIFSRAILRNDSFKWMQRPLHELNIVATYNLAYNASVMAKAGMGYVLTLDKLINTTGESELCFRPLSPALTLGMSFVWKKYQVFSRAAEYFLEKLQKKVSEISCHT